MTKTAKTPYPLGPHLYLNSPFKGVLSSVFPFFSGLAALRVVFQIVSNKMDDITCRKRRESPRDKA